MERNDVKIWNFYAPVYNVFMRQNQSAYKKMYRRIRKEIYGREVLELAAGTGLISKNTAETAASYLATDFSENMLAQAKHGKMPENLRFMKADASDLPFEDDMFDTVIISNALHIIPEPEKVLAEIKRVLRPEGLLIAPNFIHETPGLMARFTSGLLEKCGIVFEAKWDRNDYREFLEENGFKVKTSAVLKASIPLMYTESVIRR